MKKLITSSSTLWSFLIAMVMMMVAQSAWAEYVPLTALRGTGGEGRGEGYQALVDTYDGKNGRSGTKWGQRTNFSAGDEAWVIVKAEKAFSPENYYLVTANDTNGDQGRQWTGWNIYGANFTSDGEAVKDADAWVLIDQRVGADVSMQNFGLTEFKMDTDPDNLQNGSEVAYDGTPYQYYMIEVTSMKSDGSYLQMGEFGFGTYADFTMWLDIQGQDLTKPLTYRALGGDPTGFNANAQGVGGEGYANLFDNNSGSKWCCTITNREKGAAEGGAYFIVKASRYIAPTYYSLTTANDTKDSNRNWKQWQVYGMNASSDDEATRTSDKWVLLDDKENIGADQLPNANYTQAFFTLSAGNTTSYRYFKVELDRVWGGQIGDDALMQMSEFALGDASTLDIVRNSIIESFGYNSERFAEKALLDQMAAIIAQVSACQDPAQMGPLNTQGTDLKNKINASANKYAELTTVRNKAINQLNENNVVAANVAYVTSWISETEVIAPNADFPVGNFAYIRSTRELTGEKASEEAKRMDDYLFNSAIKLEDPINGPNADGEIDPTFYTWIGGSGGFNGESDANLYDANREVTKWCTNSLPAWTIFKTKVPIKPSYYGLVTGGDTFKYPSRNWKSWKIWASVDSLGRNDNGWVLIDQKSNVGTEVLKTYNTYESYIDLSEGCSVPYQYFKIEVTEAVNGDLIQMNEFAFYNTGNFPLQRQAYVDEFVDYKTSDYTAYKGYTQAWDEKYARLHTITNAPDMMNLKNELVELMDTIDVSVQKYELYEELVTTLKSSGTNFENLKPWFDGYTTENVAPNKMFRRGTYEYITQNLSLDNQAMGNVQYLYDSSDSKNDNAKKYYDRYKYQPASGEIGFVENMIAAADFGRYILVEGNTDEQWGDGYHGNLIDSYFLNDTTVVGDTVIKVNDKDVTYKLHRVKLGTKWGGNAKGNGEFLDTYIIFRTPEPTNPFFYTLTTGDDTASNTSRNWGTWYIYGGNFECDADATKDAEGWDLIDVKENIGQERLHPVNCQPSYFGFSSETETEYTYYKVVVTKPFKGSQIQMNDLHFGTPEEFEEIQQEYIAKANEFDYDVVAEQTLIDQYEQAILDIDECKNMEVLFRVNYTIEELQKRIKASVAAYENYAAVVDEAKTYLQENPLAESDALTVFLNYLNGAADEGPSETYPNGVSAYILDEHVLADSVLADEIEFMESLKAAAVEAGYGKGVDISSLIVNRTFEKAGETLKNEAGTDVGREAEGWDGYIFRTATDNEATVYAAEFCNYLAKFDVSQTLTNMKNGFYKVTLNAAYRANGNLHSYNYAPIAYANDMKTFVPVIQEDGIENKEDAWTGTYPDHDIYACDVYGAQGNAEEDSVVVAYGMWGCEGAANAFRQGHYVVTLVAQVTDGKLTFGVKNEGTSGNEWTAVGNFGLWYLGETADDAATALAEAQAYDQARIATLTERYISDIDGGNYAEAPGFSAAQKSALVEDIATDPFTYEAAKSIGETMQAIYYTKMAYANLYTVSNKVYDKWLNFSSADADAADADVNIVRTQLDEGSIDAAEADAAAEELLAKYPDYMEVAPYNDNVSVETNDEGENGEAFNYTAYAVGNNPSVLIGGHFYDELKDDEIIFAFEYSATTALPNSRFFFGKDADDSQAIDIAVPEAAELTTAFINLSEIKEKWNFGKTNDVIRWRFATGQSDVEVGLRQCRILTKAEAKLIKGITLLSVKGDFNGDFTIDAADAEFILTLIAGEQFDASADLNNDGVVNAADLEYVLTQIASQE